METAQICAGPQRPLLAASKRGLKHGLGARAQTETPPLWARWACKGKPVEVPIIGNRNKRVLYGGLNIKTGAICLEQAQKRNQESFQEHLRHLKAQWRGWNIVLFLDRGSPHTAKRSRSWPRSWG